MTIINNITNSIELLKKGGGIHIKPENRGKFTRLKKRTGKSASWFKAHGTPAQKKMATFALNARKWKHQEGGVLKAEDGIDSDLFNFTKSFETFSPTVYERNGQKLIGYGSANKELIKKGKITEKEAAAQVEKDYKEIYNTLKRNIKNWNNLSTGVKHALLDTAYNIGVYKLLNNSPKLMEMLNSGVTDAVELSKQMDHNKSSTGWLGVRSASRRAMARDAYDYNAPKKDKYGRVLDPNKQVGEKDYEASPYYFSEKPSYKEWISRVNPNFISNMYDLETAYNNLPYEELEIWRINPSFNHLPSGTELNNGDYKYLKHVLHPTFLLQSQWENFTPEGREWRSQYYSDGTYPFPTLKRKK